MELVSSGRGRLEIVEDIRWMMENCVWYGMCMAVAVDVLNYMAASHHDGRDAGFWAMAVPAWVADGISGTDGIG